MKQKSDSSERSMKLRILNFKIYKEKQQKKKHLLPTPETKQKISLQILQASKS